MGRQEKIAQSIARAITHVAKQGPDARGLLAAIIALFSTFFSLYQLSLEKYRNADFAHLRRDCWGVDDNSYTDSFRRSEGQQKEDALVPIGDMGFSGSVSVTFDRN